jgi:uncharacterized protein YcbX
MSDSPDYSMKTFHIPNENKSYFEKNIESAVEKARVEITEGVRNEANQVIHKIVLEKDAEINSLKENISELEAKLETLEQQPTTVIQPPAGEVSDLTDFEVINNAFIQAIKYGEKTQDNLNNDKLELVREVMVSWKEFFEEYKWKSNYISNKIKKLLKDTNDIL